MTKLPRIMSMAAIAFAFGAIALFISFPGQRAEAASRHFTTSETIMSDETIDPTETWTVDSGVTLTIASGASVVNREGTINNQGTINNLGIIRSAGTINNYDTITNGGTFNNSGTFNNKDTFDNNLGGIFGNQNALNNDGTITNSGTMENNIGGTTDNAGTIRNSGTFNNNYGGGTTNTGTIRNFFSGTFNINDGGGFTNKATVNNDGIINNNGATMSNNGTINNNSGGYITNDSHLTIWSAGIVNNFGIFDNNKGSISNFGTINNSNEMSSGGRIQNYQTIENSGTFNNNFVIDNSGTINNNPGGIINNNPDGTINNFGTINNKCSAQFNNNGTYTGNPVNYESCPTNFTLAPASANNPVGGTHTVTATLTDSSGSPKAGIVVTFNVSSGPNAGAAGVCNPVSCATDASGQVTFTYTDAGGAGTDTIKASFTDNSGVVHESNAVTKAWFVPTAGLEIHKFVTLDTNGIHVGESVGPIFQQVKIVEATLVEPDRTTIHVYHDIPVDVPAGGTAAIAFSGNWAPTVSLTDGKWELKLQIIATYQDPVTGEPKNVEQKIIIQFDVVEGSVSIPQGDFNSIGMNKDIILTPHPAQLNGNMDIKIDESITGQTGVFVTGITMAKPSGEIISLDHPIDISSGPATVSVPGSGWICLPASCSPTLDQAGMWQLHVEIVGFYKDGTMAIKKVDQKLWIDFNVIPESMIGTLALIASSFGAFAAYKRIRNNRNDTKNSADLGI